MPSQSISRVKTTDRQNLPNNDSFNDYQFYPDNSVLNAAVSQLMHSRSQYTTINSTNEIRVAGNDRVSYVAGPKNVKFLVPLTQSGVTSNESTLGLVESTTRTITHVRDIFPLNSSLQSQTITNPEVETITSSNSVIRASLFDVECRQTATQSDSEEIPLLPSDNSNDN